MFVRKKILIALHWQIFIALLIGILIGILFPHSSGYFSWMGDLFLRLLKMIMIPLIVSSIISGITNLSSNENLGRLGLKTIVYYLCTSLLAIITGQILVNMIKPGMDADLGLQKDAASISETSLSLQDILIRLVPENIFQALMEADMLAIIFFSIFLGIFINQSGKKTSSSLSSLFHSLFEVMMKMTNFIIKLAPLGILGIIVNVVSEQENPVLLIKDMGVYMLTVIAALFIHATITLPAIIILIGKANPVKHLKNMTSALLTAFSTSSSSATLPLTISSVEQKSGVSNKVSSFTLPLGATINMDGTALYELVAVIFIAQAYGHDLSLATQFIIALTALLASIGAAGIPMAGMVMMSVVLSAAGLPLEGIGLIISVDRLLDMFRTSVNVWSDSCGAVLIAKTEGESLNL
jgi:Na+/H+-dicarboxylate symporter